MTDNDENYYRALAVIDRCCKEVSKKGWTQYQFGKKVFRSPTQWLAIVNAKNLPKAETLKRLAAALDVSVEYLLNGKNYGLYKSCQVNLKKVLSLPRRHGLNPGQRVLFSHIRNNGQSDICLPVVFGLEDVFGVPAHELIFNYPEAK